MMLDHVYEQLELTESNRILMKIDVEGMEESVLLGASAFIKKNSQTYSL